MQISCPNCDRPIEQESPPIRGASNDGSEAWICTKCTTIICNSCYGDHYMKVHLTPKKPTVGGKKNNKNKK